MECLNKIKLIGEIVSPLEFSHVCHGENFLKTKIKTNRISGVADVLNVCIPENAMYREIVEGDGVEINGRIETRNEMVQGKKKLNVYVFASEISPLDINSGVADENTVILEGFICKQPTFRITPLGREITDIMLASNRRYGKSVYVPTITWGRQAKLIANVYEVGSKLKVYGRLQSRLYLKDGVEMVAYELSVKNFEVESEENYER